MVRSLYSGISGLRNEQTAMDVIGNNIANVNTTGFKAGRVTFEESMSQLIRGSSRAPGAAGGTNPLQIGLGMNVASVDTILSQGNLQATGQVTDLAIEGRGYFVYSNGEGNYYSRNGALQFDSTGRLVSPTNGFVLQGRMAASDGTYPPGTRIGDIRIPFGEKAPANETTEVVYSSNLDSDSQALGTIAHTNRFLASVNSPATTLATDLVDGNGNSLGIRPGDILTISGEDSLGNVTSARVAVTETTSYSDIIAEINNVVSNISPGNSAAANADGGVTITAGNTLNNLMVSSNRPGSRSYVANTFTWGPSLAAGDVVASGSVRRPAIATDLLADLYDASGNTLGLQDGDVISVNGSLGGNPVPTHSITYAGATTSMQDVLDAIRTAFNLPQFDGTLQNNPSVSLDAGTAGDDRLPDGSIAIRGQQEAAFSIDGLSISASNNDLTTIAPTRFVSNMVATTVQLARDVGQHSTSITVYDRSGDSHVLTTTFTHSGQPGEWLWEITMGGGEMIVGGNTGRITFGQDGSPSSFTFNDGSNEFQFDPMNGSNLVSIRPDVGTPGAFEGITQFRSPSTTAARDQDGYPMGKLQEISFNEFGEIQGLYSNGVTKSIAEIYLAEFNNPAGLHKKGDSMFAESNNSGEAVLLQPGVGMASKIKPGALEMSNVDLATEFTNMITTQRGYQASARVITTSDSMLQELVQLVR